MAPSAGPTLVDGMISGSGGQALAAVLTGRPRPRVARPGL